MTITLEGEMRESTAYLEMDESDSEPPPPELKLALAVVNAALFDMRTGARPIRKYEVRTLHSFHEMKGEEAKRFLLETLNEEDNLWGQVLREYGMRPLTPVRLAYLMRYKPRKGGRGSLEEVAR